MSRSGKIALALFLCISVMSVCAPLLSSYDPDRIDLDSLREAPGGVHLLGTDHKGRDMLSRILYGGRISIGIAGLAAVCSMAIGLLLGLCSGYFGGKIDAVIMGCVDLVLAFPSLLLAIGISIMLPAGVYTVLIAIVAVGWASFARLIRGHVLSVREMTFVDAARAVGCSNMRILWVHIFPQCIPILLVMTGLKAGGYLLTEASLSFLGLGAQPPTATWGSMINAGRAYITSAPWTVFFPGCMIAITAVCLNLCGDSLRDRYGIDIRG